MMNKEKLSVEIRDAIYKGGNDCLRIFEDINFGFKYTILLEKLSEQEKKYITEYLKEMLENLSKTKEKIIEDYGIEEYELEE